MPSRSPLPQPSASPHSCWPRPTRRHTRAKAFGAEPLRRIIIDTEVISRKISGDMEITAGAQDGVLPLLRGTEAGHGPQGALSFPPSMEVIGFHTEDGSPGGVLLPSTDIENPKRDVFRCPRDRASLMRGSVTFDDAVGKSWVEHFPNHAPQNLNSPILAAMVSRGERHRPNSPRRFDPDQLSATKCGC
jgi:hypothetical protein